jgi:dihydroorotate dehydrogenase electron transfer subunit
LAETVQVTQQMQQEAAQITSIGLYDPLPGFVRLQLAAPALAASLKPGQFILVSIETEYVRRPLFPIAIEHDGFSVLLPPNGTQRQPIPGDEMDCIGPMGHGFPLAPVATNLLLLAQHTGFGISQEQNGVTFLLTSIDRALADGKRVLLIHQAPTAAQLFPLAELPPGVEVRLITEDGSSGKTGSALDLLPELAQWADRVYAVGDPEWYRTLVRVLTDHRLRVGEGLAWGLLAPAIMPCGLGVCGGCAVDTSRGFQYSCTDGPVFDLTKV